MERMATFTCVDADGNEHEYTVHLFLAEEGEKILWELVSLVGPAAGGLLVAWVNGGGIDASLDTSGLGAELGTALRRANMPGLRRALLNKTYRDGQALNTATTFNAAYTANYGEMFKAQWEVLRVNRIFTALATLLDSGTANQQEAPPNG